MKNCPVTKPYASPPSPEDEDSCTNWIKVWVDPRTVLHTVEGKVVVT
jgi:hypothetical protein